MKLPRQPEIVNILVTCSHEGDCNDAKELIFKHLESRFDHVQSWKVKDGAHSIVCYPRAVND